MLFRSGEIAGADGGPAADDAVGQAAADGRGRRAADGADEHACAAARLAGSREVDGGVGRTVAKRP